MMPITSCQPSILSAVIRALGVSHGLRTLPFHIPPTQRLALAWVRLLVGLLVLALQGALVAWPSSARPRLIAHDPGSSPWVMCLVTGVFPALSGSRESRVVVSADHRWLPRYSLARDVNDSDDDDPVAFAMRAAAVLGLPPETREGITGDTHSHFWPLRFLARPQLLTRL
jgi:hypothetical protein